MALYRPPELADPAKVAAGTPIAFAGPHARVLFGPGSAAGLGMLASELGSARPAVISTPDRVADAEQLMALLPGDPVLMPEAVMHTPVEVSDAAAQVAVREGVDLIVSVGGGSSIGLGKALTKRLGLKHVTLPTTYSGSEITPILGESKDGDKLTVRDDALRPSVVIYDPQLSATLPPRIAAASGMNAMAHAVEALTVSDDPDILWAARRSIEIFAEALPAIVAGPGDGAARTRGFYAAWLAAYCLAEVPMALHHKLCHALGGAYAMPHAETHAAMLAHTFAYNLPACPDAGAATQHILGEDSAGRIFDLVAALGLPTRLADLGLPEEGIEVVARLACANPYKNPRPFDEPAIVGLLRRAWSGSRPTADFPHA